jgi:hypothetical protein
MQFNPSLVSANSNPTAWFRGADGTSPVTWWTQGDALGQTGASTSPNGTANFNGGTINALVNTMYLGRSPDGANGGTTDSTGTLSFDSGIFTVRTLIAGYEPRATNDFGIGVINVSSNTALGSGATLVVTGTLDLGLAAGGGGAINTYGALNVTNGAVFANTIICGTNNSPNNSINLIGGLLVATNPIASAFGPLANLTLAPMGTPDNSVNTLALPAGFGPGATVTTLNIDALDTTTNIINIVSVGPVGDPPLELPLIQYSSMNFVAGGTFNIGLGTLPSGYSGYLTNDTAQSMIALMLTGAIHPQPMINSVTVQSNTNLVMSGVNGFANAPYYVVGSTNVTQPLSTWTRVATNVFGPTGNFSFSAPMDKTRPQQFYTILVTPTP